MSKFPFENDHFTLKTWPKCSNFVHVSILSLTSFGVLWVLQRPPPSKNFFGWKEEGFQTFFGTVRLFVDENSWVTRKVSLFRLVCWKEKGKVFQLLQVRTDSERILQLLSQNDMPRAHICLDQLILKGASVSKFLNVLTRVSEGTYVPKSYCYSADRQAVMLAKFTRFFGQVITATILHW